MGYISLLYLLTYLLTYLPRILLNVKDYTVYRFVNYVNIE